MQLISLSSGGDSAVAQLQTQETTRPGGSAAHQSDFTPEIPLARALEKMHCLKDRQDHVMIDQQLSSSYLIEVYKKAPLPTSKVPNFLVLYSQFPSQALQRHEISMAASTQPFSIASSFPTGEGNMTEAQFSEWCTKFENPKFEDDNFQEMNFEGMNFEEMNFEEMNFDNAMLHVTPGDIPWGDN
ncbi:hypothetical protein V500_01507 [Pseudogymnoascus sp. VKM F-4518 (FW-2643)]|nr:hypothetical protein V500_01507 [Pseudogymnoascus sp. VKM F-4518 (FW-2643)]